MHRSWQLGSEGAACDCYASPVALSAACRVTLVFKTARVKAEEEEAGALESSCPAQVELVNAHGRVLVRHILSPSELHDGGCHLCLQPEVLAELGPSPGLLHLLVFGNRSQRAAATEQQQAAGPCTCMLLAALPLLCLPDAAAVEVQRHFQAMVHEEQDSTWTFSEPEDAAAEELEELHSGSTYLRLVPTAAAGGSMGAGGSRRSSGQAGSHFSAGVGSRRSSQASRRSSAFYSPEELPYMTLVPMHQALGAQQQGGGGTEPRGGSSSGPEQRSEAHRVRASSLLLPQGSAPSGGSGGGSSTHRYLTAEASATSAGAQHAQHGSTAERSTASTAAAAAGPSEQHGRTARSQQSQQQQRQLATLVPLYGTDAQPIPVPRAVMAPAATLRSSSTSSSEQMHQMLESVLGPPLPVRSPHAAASAAFISQDRRRSLNYQPGHSAPAAHHLPPRRRVSAAHLLQLQRGSHAAGQNPQLAPASCPSHFPQMPSSAQAQTTRFPPMPGSVQVQVQALQVEPASPASPFRPIEARVFHRDYVPLALHLGMLMAASHSQQAGSGMAPGSAGHGGSGAAIAAAGGVQGAGAAAFRGDQAAQPLDLTRLVAEVCGALPPDDLAQAPSLGWEAAPTPLYSVAAERAFGGSNNGSVFSDAFNPALELEEPSLSGHTEDVIEAWAALHREPPAHCLAAARQRAGWLLRFLLQHRLSACFALAASWAHAAGAVELICNGSPVGPSAAVQYVSEQLAVFQGPLITVTGLHRDVEPLPPQMAEAGACQVEEFGEWQQQVPPPAPTRRSLVGVLREARVGGAGQGQGDVAPMKAVEEVYAGQGEKSVQSEHEGQAQGQAACWAQEEGAALQLKGVEGAEGAERLGQEVAAAEAERAVLLQQAWAHASAALVLLLQLSATLWSRLCWRLVQGAQSLGRIRLLPGPMATPTSSRPLSQQEQRLWGTLAADLWVLCARLVFTVVLVMALYTAANDAQSKELAAACNSPAERPMPGTPGYVSTTMLLLSRELPIILLLLLMPSVYAHHRVLCIGGMLAVSSLQVRRLLSAVAHELQVVRVPWTLAALLYLFVETILTPPLMALSLPDCYLVVAVQAAPLLTLLLAHELWPSAMGMPSRAGFKQAVDSALVLNEANDRHELALSLCVVACLGLAQTLAVAARSKRT